MAIKYSTIGGGSGTGFNVQIGSKYSYATFTQALPAGAYTIKSSNNYTNWDVYLLGADSSLIAYTGTASISPVSAFSAIVVVNGTVNDIIQFSYQTTVFSTAETTQTTAGPFITAATPTSLPNANNTITVTGGNFAAGVTATFTGTDLTPRTAKGIVRNSATSLTITRPDNMPVSAAPYTLTLGNPGISNPTNSNAHTFANITVGVVPVWVTAATLPLSDSSTAYSTTVVATDADGGSSVTYSYVSGTLPAGISFNATTGVISGTYSGSTNGIASYTIRATDSGANYVDRTFTISYTIISGGTLSSDATYYYRTFTSNGTLAVPGSLFVDYLVVAGGGGGGSDRAGGGGGGGLLQGSQLLSANSYIITIGSGGAGSSADVNKGNNGINTTAFSLTAIGGGGGGSENNKNGASGGSGGGSSYGSGSSGGSGTSGQGNRGGNGKDNGRAPGGGGGAGAQGMDGADGVQVNGGAGLSVFGTYYAGGGGAGDNRDGSGTSLWGNGGIGGGGAGGERDGSIGNSPNGYGKPGANGLGGGGGGAHNFDAGVGGNGGSGTVVVRYTRASVGG